MIIRCYRCGRYTRVLYCATLFSSGATTCAPNCCPRCVCTLPVVWLEVRGQGGLLPRPHTRPFALVRDG